MLNRPVITYNINVHALSPALLMSNSSIVDHDTNLCLEICLSGVPERHHLLLLGHITAAPMNLVFSVLGSQLFCSGLAFFFEDVGNCDFGSFLRSLQVHHSKFLDMQDIAQMESKLCCLNVQMNLHSELLRQSLDPILCRNQL